MAVKKQAGPARGKAAASKPAPKAASKPASKPAPKAAAAKTAKPAKAKAARFDLSVALGEVPAEAAKQAPSMPVRVALLEASRLWAAASKVRAKFVALAEFPAEAFDAIPHLNTALEDAEKEWQRLRQAMKLKSLVVVRKEAEAQRRIVMVAGRYLLRKSSVAQLELDRIQEGEGLADLIQDLDDLADLVGSNMDVMTRDKRITEATPGQLRAMAQTLKDGEDSEAALKAQEHRNTVFAALYAALREVRAAAGYLYADDPKRLLAYRSQYEANLRRLQRKKQKEKAAD